MKKKERPHVLYVSSFPPRECGIATFTDDLTNAMDRRFNPKISSRVLAMNTDETTIFNYGKKVVLQLAQDDHPGYQDAAERIDRMDSIRLVNVQHEFGIFGGEQGRHLLSFLERIRKPVIITFHSVIPSPDRRTRQLVAEIASHVESIVVMTESAAEILKKEYGISTPVHIIPHGIHNVPFETQSREKRNAGYAGNLIISSFGMINPDKGYEYVIDALPKVLKRFPNLLYLIIGKTHPVVERYEGEKYRNSLVGRINRLGLQKNVKFYNKYLTLAEIIKYLKMSDIYISSSMSRTQITSGTLSYAMGCGRAVISTSFPYAKDMVTPETGILVGFRKPESFSKAIIRLLSDDEKRKGMELSAYARTRHMTWENVALSYGRLFEKYGRIEEFSLNKIPDVNISQLERLTDRFGIIQFANHTAPDRESGYTLDDNARALITAGMLYSKTKNRYVLGLVKIYLDFIKYVKKGSKLYNYVDKNRKISLAEWIQDAQGRAIRATGFLQSLKEIPRGIKDEAKKIFLDAIGAASELSAARAIAHSIAGLYYYNIKEGSADIARSIRDLSERLMKGYRSSSRSGWRWFENALTYDNSILPESMFYSYLATKDKSYLKVAKEALDFLVSKTMINGIFVPIGQKGWYRRNRRRAYFDQQPIEAAATVNTLMLAYKVLKIEEYKQMAIKAYSWFLGRNSTGQMVYDVNSGGSYDGLKESSVNVNEGAESTLSYLIARLYIDDLVGHARGRHIDIA